MEITSFSLSGFTGISNDAQKRLTLEPLGRFNVLIGPNNAGKSAVIRYLTQLIWWMGGGEQFCNQQTTDSSFWKYDQDSQIHSRIVFKGLQNENLCNLSNELGLVKHTGEIPIACRTTSTQITFENSFFHDMTSEIPRTVAEPYYNQKSRIPMANHLTMWWKQVFSIFRDTFVFFDAVRALDRGVQNTGLEDGSRLLAILFAMQNDPLKPLEWDQFRESLRKKVNKVFSPSGMPEVTEIAMKNGPKMHLYFATMPNIPVPIDQMGTGITHLLIILSLLIQRGGKPTVVCVEEPETNLHPLLLRRFIDQLRTFSNVQFIFTTHSHVLLDCIDSEDRVFRLQQRADGSCSAELCDGIQKQHFLLDALGIRASSLLQTNCIIWVEGPSDRLYIRQWIKEAAPEFAEGRDFTFNYYGGSLLAHLELNTQDELANDFVSILWISRYAIVVMDRDLAPGESEDKLAPRKKPILESVAKDVFHRFAVVTNGREIENDVPKELLLEASASILGCDFDKIKNAEINGIKGFEHEIIAALDETDTDVIKSKTRKLNNNKIAIAMRIVDRCDGSGLTLNPPEYVTQMVDLVRRSERIEAVPNP